MSNYHMVKAAKKKEIRYSLSNKDIEKIVFDATLKGTKEAFHILCGLTCLVLHNSFGFGQKRCTVVMERMLSMFSKMDMPGGYTLQEIKDAARDLGGVKTIV